MSVYQFSFNFFYQRMTLVPLSYPILMLDCLVSCWDCFVYKRILYFLFVNRSLRKIEPSTGQVTLETNRYESKSECIQYFCVSKSFLYLPQWQTMYRKKSKVYMKLKLIMLIFVNLKRDQNHTDSYYNWLRRSYIPLTTISHRESVDNLRLKRFGRWWLVDLLILEKESWIDGGIVTITL